LKIPLNPNYDFQTTTPVVIPVFHYHHFPVFRCHRQEKIQFTIKIHTTKGCFQSIQSVQGFPTRGGSDFWETKRLFFRSPDPSVLFHPQVPWRHFMEEFREFQRTDTPLANHEFADYFASGKPGSDLKVREQKQLWSPNHQNTEDYKMINIMTVPGSHSIQNFEQIPVSKIGDMTVSPISSRYPYQSFFRFLIPIKFKTLNISLSKKSKT